jgi:UPF0716 protein FxsA
VIFILVLIGVPVAEVFAFIEVGLAIGWLWAVVLLLATSVAGWPILRVQGRRAIERVSVAVSERGEPGRAALDGALGVLGAALLIVPGFVTDALGVLLLLGPVRRLMGGWISHRYAGRVVRFASTAQRFAPGGRGGRPGGMGGRPGAPGGRPGERRMRPADVESTAVEDDAGEIDR